MNIFVKTGFETRVKTGIQTRGQIAIKGEFRQEFREKFRREFRQKSKRESGRLSRGASKAEVTQTTPARLLNGRSALRVLVDINTSCHDTDGNVVVSSEIPIVRYDLKSKFLNQDFC